MTDTAPRLILPEREAFQRTEEVRPGTGSGMIQETGMSSTFTFDPLCMVEYDGFTLPIFAPESIGDVFAIQEGARPSWDTLMGGSKSEKTNQTVTIQRLNEKGMPEIIARHPSPLLLGRNANAQGVVVEHPKDDGSRSIGLASWSDQTLTWLVDDGSVNAFGWITESGRLIYSSRKMDEVEFRIKVLEADGTVWEIPENLPFSWVLPILSEDETSIFAIRLGDGYGDMIWGSSKTPGDFRKSQNVYRISDRFTPALAWQTLASTTGGNGISNDQIAWYSFDLRRMILWNGKRNSTQLMPFGVLACDQISPDDEWLITTTTTLERIRFLENAIPRTRLLSGPWIARRASADSAIIVKASERTLELGLLTFDRNKRPANKPPLTPEPEPAYEYNIRD